MSLVFLKTHNLSWQDRTLNIELMMSPCRSQLLYNKHKGLSSKCEQEQSYLDREKTAYLRSYKTDKRLMEMRKERYDKNKNIILQRRMSVDKRSKTLDSESFGRNSAPPRLEQSQTKDEKTFLTKIAGREAKSADNGTRYTQVQPLADVQPEPVVLTPRSRFTAPGITTKESATTKGPRTHPPFLSRMDRQKSVRFQKDTDPDKTDATDQVDTERIATPIEDRIKKFLDTQAEFNKRLAEADYLARGTPGSGSRASSVAKRYTGLKLKVSELEKAFDNFCGNSNTDSYHNLVRYAAKMKANVKNARNTSLVPSVSSFKSSQIFKGVNLPKAWIPSVR